MLDLMATALPQDFHFLRPAWLLGVPAVLILGLMLLLKRGSTRWEELIPADMLEALRVTGGTSGTLWKWLVPLCLLAACVAASGPTWKKIPIPTSKAQSALVILLDLSPSMLATDISPDRLTRVKYKLIDILRSREDGQTALIAYSGSPHRVAPLTDDTKTIESLLPALHPLMMPTQGSDTESAMELALEMLQAAGTQTGDILLITDGVAPEAQRTINNLLNRNYRLSILGVGSTEAVPIPKPGGGFISDARGEIVLTELNRNELQILAGFNGGRYVEMQNDDSDIRYLLQAQSIRPEQSDEPLETVYDSWEDIGYYLVLILIPIAAYSFRRGLIFGLPLLLLPLALTPQSSQALDWQDLWKTPDQQAAEALKNGDAETAAEKFEDPNWAAYAQYRNQDYAAAGQTIDTREENSSALSYYNTGNALALNGELEKAIESYESALTLEPEMEDAAYNKEIVEQLLKQQEQDQQENQENESDDSRNSDQSEDAEQSEQNSESEPSDTSETEEDQSSPEQQESEQEEGEDNQENPEQSEEEAEAESEEQNDQPEQPSDEQAEEEMNAALTPAEETPEEMDPASEQWLRGIPDDPSGLLRRKFEYESEAYRREQRFSRSPPGTEEEERY